jgi:hypothetical protein
LARRHRTRFPNPSLALRRWIPIPNSRRTGSPGPARRSATASRRARLARILRSPRTKRRRTHPASPPIRRLLHRRRSTTPRCRSLRPDRRLKPTTIRTTRRRRPRAAQRRRQKRPLTALRRRTRSARPDPSDGAAARVEARRSPRRSRCSARLSRDRFAPPRSADRRRFVRPEQDRSCRTRRSPTTRSGIRSRVFFGLSRWRRREASGSIRSLRGACSCSGPAVEAPFDSWLCRRHRHLVAGRIEAAFASARG